jgi:hypothetical protein
MRPISNHRQRLWQAFLRTPSGRQLLRDRVIHRPNIRFRKPVFREPKLWLIALIILCLLAIAIGAWIGRSTDKQRWLGDDIQASLKP